MIIALVMLGTAIVQTTAGPLLGLFGVPPGLALIAAVCVGMVRGREEGLVAGACGGLALDLLSGGPTGMHLLSMPLLGYIAGVARWSPFRSRFLLPLMVITAATLMYIAVGSIILRLTGRPLDASMVITQVAVPSILTNAVFMLVIFWFVLLVFDHPGDVRSTLA